MLIDGVNTRQDATIDQGTGNGPDVGSLEEMQIVTVGGTAEQALPGVFLNMIVKSGGNQFHGRYEVQNVSDNFQSDNITTELKAQGVTVGDAFKVRQRVVRRPGRPGHQGQAVVLRGCALAQVGAQCAGVLAGARAGQRLT
jgi:hypothetical protein